MESTRFEKIMSRVDSWAGKTWGWDWKCRTAAASEVNFILSGADTVVWDDDLIVDKAIDAWEEVKLGRN